jgi:phage-related protein
MPDDERQPQQHKRQWRDYRTATGARPVRDFLDSLSDDDLSAVAAEMKMVEQQGLERARHLRGDIYEIRANAPTQSYRILFATEGRYQQVLLSLEGFSKKTQKTPPDKIRLAEQRLADWRRRGAR